MMWWCEYLVSECQSKAKKMRVPSGSILPPLVFPIVTSLFFFLFMFFRTFYEKSK